MPYRPAWACLSEFLSRMAGSRTGFELLAYKAVLCSAWMSTVVLVYRALRDSPLHQATAILILGWLPLSVVDANVEGHNDILMVALLTGWLVSRNPASGVMLVASVLVKYATAPVMLVAAMDAWFRRSWRISIALVVVAMIGGAVFVHEWNGGALLAGLRPNQGFHAYSAVAFVYFSARALGLDGIVAAIPVVAVRLILLALVFIYARRHAAQLSARSLSAFVAVTLLAAVLGANYFWPWYWLWLLPSLLLALDPFLLKVTLPFIILTPFCQLLRLGGMVRVGFTVSRPLATALLWAALGACWVGMLWWRKSLLFSLPGCAGASSAETASSG